MASCSSDDDNSGPGDAASGELVATVDGAGFSANAASTAANVQSNVLTITAENANGDNIAITLTPFNGEAEYDLSGFTSEATAIYLPNGDNQFYNSGNEGGAGTITILTVDTAAGTISGNFNFTAVRTNSNGPNETVEVSNGTFINVTTTGL